MNIATLIEKLFTPDERAKLDDLMRLHEKIEERTREIKDEIRSARSSHDLLNTEEEIAAARARAGELTAELERLEAEDSDFEKKAEKLVALKALTDKLAENAPFVELGERALDVAKEPIIEVLDKLAEIFLALCEHGDTSGKGKRFAATRAKGARNLYQAYIAEGFTEDQRWTSSASRSPPATHSPGRSRTRLRVASRSGTRTTEAHTTDGHMPSVVSLSSLPHTRATADSGVAAADDRAGMDRGSMMVEPRERGRNRNE